MIWGPLKEDTMLGTKAEMCGCDPGECWWRLWRLGEGSATVWLQTPSPDAWVTVTLFQVLKVKKKKKGGKEEKKWASIHFFSLQRLFFSNIGHCAAVFRHNQQFHSKHNSMEEVWFRQLAPPTNLQNLVAVSQAACSRQHCNFFKHEQGSQRLQIHSKDQGCQGDFSLWNTILQNHFSFKPAVKVWKQVVFEIHFNKLINCVFFPLGTFPLLAAIQTSLSLSHTHTVPAFSLTTSPQIWGLTRLLISTGWRWWLFCSTAVIGRKKKRWGVFFLISTVPEKKYKL